MGYGIQTLTPLELSTDSLLAKLSSVVDQVLFRSDTLTEAGDPQGNPPGDPSTPGGIGLGDPPGDPSGGSIGGSHKRISQGIPWGISFGDSPKGIPLGELPRGALDSLAVLDWEIPLGTPGWIRQGGFHR